MAALSSPFFHLGKRATFAEAFPSIETFRVEVSETDISDVPNKHVVAVTYDGLHPPRPYFDCHNPLCYNGGVNLQEILQEVVSRGQMSARRTVMCQGYEGSPKGRRRDGPCDHRFDVAVTLNYKTDAS